MEANSTLKLIDSSGAADLRRIRVTMEPVTSGDPSKLIVNGEIIGGTMSADEGCQITVGLADISSDSELSGEWTLSNGAQSFFESRMHSSASGPLVLTLQDGSTMTIAKCPYDYYPFDITTENELIYGDGNNVLLAGDPEAESAENFMLGNSTRIRPSTNTSELTLELAAEMYTTSSFAHSFVRDAWDTRNVDIVLLPIDSYSTYGTQAFENISADLESSYPDSPVVFIDVPCIGTWRDLTLPEPTTVSGIPISLIEDFNNAITDGTGATAGGASSPPEVSVFRDVTIGSDRELRFGVSTGRIYYYGDLTIDPAATISYTPISGPTIEVTENTNPAISDLIVPACATIYGDWNGDCEITTTEIRALQAALDNEEYNPLYDRNCDGELTTGVEKAAILANYTTQPTCDCGRSMMAFGGGGGSMSEEEYLDLAEWIASGLSPS